MSVEYYKPTMKPIRITFHAEQRAKERGASKEEVELAIRNGMQEEAKNGRKQFRINIEYGKQWLGTTYAIKQVVPVTVDEGNEIVVITVYVFYF